MDIVVIVFIKKLKTVAFYVKKKELSRNELSIDKYYLQ